MLIDILRTVWKVGVCCPCHMFWIIWMKCYFFFLNWKYNSPSINLFLIVLLYNFKSFSCVWCQCGHIQQWNSDLRLLVLSVQGIENIRNEIQDTMEPLIDPVHGHGRYQNTSSPFLYMCYTDTRSSTLLQSTSYLGILSAIPFILSLYLYFAVRAWWTSL